MSTSIQSLGGKARAANMTPEERTRAARHAATKGARKLGKEGRRLRALKGAATRKARQEASDTLQIKGYLPVPPSKDEIMTGLAPLARPMSEAPPVVQALAKALSPLVDGSKFYGGPPASKAKRPEPRAGTMNAKVLDVIRRKGPIHSDMIGDWLIPSEPRHVVRNALSSLRTAGHVVSEPKPGSRREKLWRLA